MAERKNGMESLCMNSHVANPARTVHRAIGKIGNSADTESETEAQSHEGQYDAVHEPVN